MNWAQSPPFVEVAALVSVDDVANEVFGSRGGACPVSLASLPRVFIGAYEIAGSDQGEPEVSRTEAGWYRSEPRIWRGTQRA